MSFVTVFLATAALCSGLVLNTGASTGPVVKTTPYGGGALMTVDPGGGYWTVSGVGTVSPHDGAVSYGSPAAWAVWFTGPIVAITATPDGGGYWLLTSYGGVYDYGDAHNYGSDPYSQDFVGMAVTPDGGGYWLLGSNGQVDNFGDAQQYGSANASQSVVGITATPDGLGYWLVSSDGAIFNFGDAGFFGSVAASAPTQPIVAMASSPDGKGYWLVGSDGGVYNFGDAGFYGTLAGTGASVIGIIVIPGTPGYILVEANGSLVVLPVASTVPTTTTTTSTTTTTEPSTTTTTATTEPPTTTTTSTTQPSNSGDGNGSNCGGTPMYKVDGTEWQCTFDDEFSGTTLDTSKWVVQQTATSGYTAGPDCYVDSPNNISVSGGTLNLTLREEAAPFTCQDPYGNFTTQYTSGMVSTYGLFDQTYGLFEVRAKLPPATIQGLQETFWMYPQDETAFGDLWPDNGEIDFAEFYSEYPNLDIPYIHYNSADNDPDVTSYNCSITDQTQFNTYGLLWTSSTLTVLYNGKTCLVDSWDPAFPLVKPEPFNQPFFIALTQALGTGSNAFEPGATPLPATTQIDWVRAWS
jgi:beta-glucanase (GH16 family)